MSEDAGGGDSANNVVRLHGRPLRGRHRDRSPLVLVAEDHEDCREMYVALLGFAGFSVVKAADGGAAIAAARAELPNVILMDLEMPRTDGWTAIRALKSDPVTALIPIVAASGHGLPHHVELALEAGCDAFLAKPSLPEDLLVAILACIGRGPRKAGVRKSSARNWRRPA
jgi:two-component system, cell cycle response regulator DivK